jgi:ribosome-associated protein
MTNTTVVKKDTQKLQRAIVDGLEDVKAQEIQVFDTEHLSALFERVVIASGTSNRQTKALAASVRDAVREAGFPKPRIEGEDNGEWIIVDCGQAVVHIMQPSFRTYYNLEELWGEKPVRLKFGSAKPETEANKPVAKPAAKEVLKPEGSLRRSNAAKKGVADAFPSKAQLKKTAAAKTPAKKVSIQAAPDAPEASRKPVARKAAPAKSAATKTAPVKKVAAKTAVKVASKVLVVNAPAKTTAKVVAKKAAIKKSVARKA